jgi:hypothetical protein
VVFTAELQESLDEQALVLLQETMLMPLVVGSGSTLSIGATEIATGGAQQQVVLQQLVRKRTSLHL